MLSCPLQRGEGFARGGGRRGHLGHGPYRCQIFRQRKLHGDLERIVGDYLLGLDDLAGEPCTGYRPAGDDDGGKASRAVLLQQVAKRKLDARCHCSHAWHNAVFEVIPQLPEGHRGEGLIEDSKGLIRQASGDRVVLNDGLDESRCPADIRLQHWRDLFLVGRGEIYLGPSLARSFFERHGAVCGVDLLARVRSLGHQVYGIRGSPVQNGPDAAVFGKYRLTVMREGILTPLLSPRWRKGWLGIDRHGHYREMEREDVVHRSHETAVYNGAGRIGNGSAFKRVLRCGIHPV